ncbi:MAG: STAS domain-containing protein [Candidatus Poribacteria bacterium]|nr:STAS domain-containing protein [Candidatus Poribacteria bacterium]
MTIDVTRQHDVSILKPGGRLISSDDVRSLKKSMYNEIAKNDPPKLLIDFDGVKMMSSIGLGAIMEAGLTVKQKGGRIAVIHISSHIKSLLVMSHLMSHFEHFNSEHEGVVALAS